MECKTTQRTAVNICLQEISANVAEKTREELKNHLSNHAEAIARNQDAKRHQLESEIRDIVFACEAGVSEEVRRVRNDFLQGCVCFELVCTGMSVQQHLRPLLLLVNAKRLRYLKRRLYIQP